jgi:hypothetical protein
VGLGVVGAAQAASSVNPMAKFTSAGNFFMAVLLPILI